MFLELPNAEMSDFTIFDSYDISNYYVNEQVIVK